MSQLTLLSVLLVVAGLAFVITGVRRLFQRRFLKAAGLEISGLFFLLLASSSFLLASNLYTYQRLVYEQSVAEISFQRLDSQKFRVELMSLQTKFHKIVELHGDEWQLDAQVLTWRGLATLFGMDANYRLFRISGRYSDITLEQQRPRSVFSLVQQAAITEAAMIEAEGFDLWQFAHKYQNWVHWVDAAYGSAVFLPMTDGAKYSISISRTGLIARPANDVARKAVSQWIGL